MKILTELLTNKTTEWLKQNCTILSDNLEITDREIKQGSTGVRISYDVYLNEDVDVIPDYVNIEYVTKFIIKNNKNLTSLKNSPRKCLEFLCKNCDKIKNLEGMPSNVRKLILINLNKLETLDGITQNVSDTFIIHGCRNLKSLKGCPQSLQMFACRYCNKLITLEGGPSHVTQTYDIDSCMNLESLKGTPKTISSIEGMFLLNNCPSLKNMDYEPKIRKRNNYSKDYNY